MVLETYDAPAGSPALQGLAAVCLDCHDPRLLGGFYARLLGSAWSLEADGDAVVAGVHSTGGPNIDLLAVPEDKVVKNRVHLDLRAVDLDGAVAHALACGARLAPDVYDGDGWVVLRDPEGNEFCILRPYDGGELYWTPDSARQ